MSTDSAAVSTNAIAYATALASATSNIPIIRYDKIFASDFGLDAMAAIYVLRSLGVANAFNVQQIPREFVFSAEVVASLTDKNVLFINVPLPPTVLFNILKVAKHVSIISSIPAHNTFPNVNHLSICVNPALTAAPLTWCVFKSLDSTKDMSWLAYIYARTTFKFDVAPDAKAITDGMVKLEMDLSVSSFSLYITLPPDVMRQIGERYQTEIKEYVESAISRSESVHFTVPSADGKEPITYVPQFVSASKHQSEVGAELARLAIDSFAIIHRPTPPVGDAFSLRSSPTGVDVRTVARVFGGNGPNASTAAFTAAGYAITDGTLRITQ